MPQAGDEGAQKAADDEAAVMLLIHPALNLTQLT